MAHDIAFNTLVNEFEARERRITETRVAAARLCVGVAAQSGSKALFADVLQHFGMQQDDGWQACASSYAFRLKNAGELQLPDIILPPPQAISVRVNTDRVGATDDERIGIVFDSEQAGYSCGIHIHTFYKMPHWSFDLTCDGEQPLDEPTTEYDADQPRCAAVLNELDVAVSSCLLVATWEEIATVAGDHV